MIQLTNDLVMVADDHCYAVGVLNKQRGDNTQGGRKAHKILNPTYYTTAGQAVQGALNRAMRQAVKDGSVTTLWEFIQEQERQRAEIERLVFALDGGQPRHNAVEGHESTGEGKGYHPLLGRGKAMIYTGGKGDCRQIDVLNALRRNAFKTQKSER